MYYIWVLSCKNNSDYKTVGVQTQESEEINALSSYRKHFIHVLHCADKNDKNRFEFIYNIIMSLIGAIYFVMFPRYNFYEKCFCKYYFRGKTIYSWS